MLMQEFLQRVRGIANVNEGLIRNHDFGALDIEKFVKN
jgi:hypothetical protein